MNTRPKRLRVGLAIVATTVGAGLGGAAIAGAATSTSTSATGSSTSTAATSTAPSNAPNPATLKNGPGETLLTGTTAEKVKAAALAAVPGGTIIRVETDSEGSPYEAHVTKSDGTQVTVKIDASFKVTTTEAGFGAGPGGGGPGGGAPHGAPSGSAPTA
jgi:hypothetical protein